MTCTEATHSENAQSNDCNNRMRTEGYLIALRVFLRVYHPQQSVRDRRFLMKEKLRNPKVISTSKMFEFSSIIENHYPVIARILIDDNLI